MGWNRGVLLYIEVSSFQGIRIDSGVPLYTEVSSFQGIGFHCIQRFPHFRKWNRRVLYILKSIHVQEVVAVECDYVVVHH